MKKKHIILLVVLFGILIVVEHNRPKPVNWNLSFSKNDKIPYGGYVLRKLIESSFQNKKITENHQGLYLFQKQKPLSDTANLLFLTYTFDPDNLELETLLSLIKQGNNAFISATLFEKNFLDTLHLKQEYQWGSMIPSFEKNDHIKMYFTNPKLKTWKSYAINKSFVNNFFSSFDTATTYVLGKDEYNRVNFIRIPYGKGNIYINSLPLVFTNYNLLYGNREYAFNALSYLSGNTLVWDEYYKPNKLQVSTPIRYILSQPALKAAYIVLIIGLVIYLVFEAKRKQRVIPVIKPPLNTSLEFAETIGRLYLNKANHKDLALKKFNYFCEFLRTKYYITEILFDTVFYEKLAEKSGVNHEIIANLFNKITQFKSQEKVRDEELIQFNSLMEEFYKHAK
ncbi:MAG: hypothetical protein HY958_04695 [Bacteroidia bacterium]|nr:hypothetical protein [Bacteroidia bacterium]